MSPDVPVGEALLGRVVDPLGNPLDGRGPIEATERRPARVQGAGRHPAPAGEGARCRPGFKSIDTMTNIGRGQRELIIGDRSTGKTAILIDTILNQRNTDRPLHLRRDRPEGVDGRAGLRGVCAKRGAMEYTTIITAAANEAAPIKWMAPFRPAPRWASTSCSRASTRSSCTTTSSKHADAYRQLSLLLRRPPGREAFPGGRLLSALAAARGARASSPTTRAAVSMTALPVIETQAGDHRRVHPDERHFDHRRGRSS